MTARQPKQYGVCRFREFMAKTTPFEVQNITPHIVDDLAHAKPRQRTEACKVRSGGRTIIQSIYHVTSGDPPFGQVWPRECSPSVRQIPQRGPMGFPQKPALPIAGRSSKNSRALPIGNRGAISAPTHGRLQFHSSPSSRPRSVLTSRKHDRQPRSRHRSVSPVFKTWSWST